MSTFGSSIERPRLRGVSHQFAFFVALGAGAVLTALARGGLAVAAVAVYAATLALMFGVSASYHRGRWRPRVERWWHRADHAAIFAFIAGTYTPVAALGVGGATGARILALVWGGAGLGAVRALWWTEAPRWVSAGLYLALGWVIVAYLPEVAAATGPAVLAPLLAGGALYTLGAVVYALRWPDPAPRTFGYHEVFHVLVIAGVLCHLAAIVALVR